MKTSLALLSALLLTATTFAADLTVNASPTTETLTDEATLGIPASIGSGQIGIFTTQMTFTVPSTTPDYDDTVDADDKLVIVPDKDGQLLIANNDGKWKNTGVTITAGEPVNLTAHVKVASNDTKRLAFDVYINNATKPISVTAPSEGLSFSSLNFEGEGSATAIALSIAPTAIVPGDETTPQNTELVNNYVKWLNESTKGGATAAEDKADAFAMNVGGKPKLEITAIDVTNKTITVKGSCGETGDANLGDIYGTLYITYAETLSDKATTIAVDFPIDGDENKIDTKNKIDNGIAIVEIPDGAKFVKATVSLTEPEAKL
ncbi:MAG: hypothetical protein Q4F99_02955 [bacterium]|nr:hypothetical protein [bacterium]